MEGTVNVYMARQPIYDATQDLAAYELLFRSGQANSAGNVGPAESARSLVSSLVDIGLHRLAGDKKAFINVDEPALLSGALSILPPQKVVLEILETVEANPATISAVTQLHEAGFTIALDDFTINPHSEPFMPFAKIIKLDVMALGPQVYKEARRVAKPGVSLLAEKVETRDEFEKCKERGFQLFQGYFFSKPEIVQGSSIPPNRLAALQIASKMQDPDLDIDTLEQMIVADLALSHRLLRLVKSAHVGVGGKVASVRHAVMFLGMKTVASIATLLAMSAASTKPQELLTIAFMRAKMCELLAKMQSKPKRDRYFTVGLFSVIDALLDAPMADLLAQLPLDDEINSALLNPESDSDLALTLRTVLAFEGGAWDLLRSSLPHDDINSAYLDAVEWASENGVALQAAA